MSGVKLKKLTLYIMINIFYIFVGSYLFASEYIPHNFFAYGFIPFLLVNIILSFLFVKKGYVKGNKINYCIVLLIILGVVSTIFAVNKKVSLLGFYNRDEGLLILVYYYTLMFLTSYLSKDFKKIIIIFILITGFIQCLYAICQIFNLPFVSIAHNPEKIKIQTATGYKYMQEIWATGFIKNPNFFGSYMLICLLYSLGLFFDYNSDKRKNIFLFIISFFFMYSLVISNALSCVVGLAVTMIYLFIYCIKNHRIKKSLCIIVMMIFVLFIADLGNKTTLLNDIGITSKQGVEIAKGNLDDSYGTKRLFIWKETVKIIPKHLLHGAGIDNFYYAFDGGHLTYRNGINTYDKAHNEYLQILITEGIFTLIVYLSMCFFIVYDGSINSFKKKEIVYILPVIGYLIQAFFNISVIEVAPIFYITLGLCTDKNRL